MGGGGEEGRRGGEEERRRGGDGCVSAISRPHLVETRLVSARARPPLCRRILLLLRRRRLCRPLRSLCSGRRRRFLPRSGGGGGGGGGGHHSVIRRGAEEGAIAAHTHAVDHLGSMRGGVDWGVWTVDCGLVVHDTHTGGAGSRVSSGATRSRWHLGYASAASRLCLGHLSASRGASSAACSSHPSAVEMCGRLCGVATSSSDDARASAVSAELKYDLSSRCSAKAYSHQPTALGQ